MAKVSMVVRRKPEPHNSFCEYYGKGPSHKCPNNCLHPNFSRRKLPDDREWLGLSDYSRR